MRIDPNMLRMRKGTVLDYANETWMSPQKIQKLKNWRQEAQELDIRKAVRAQRTRAEEFAKNADLLEAQLDA